MTTPENNKKKTKITHSEDYYVRVLLHNTKIEEVMASPSISVHVDVPFHEVVDSLMDNKIRHLPVINDAKEVVGLITERDVFKIKSPRRKMDGTWYYDPAILDNIILQHVMTKDPFTLHPEDTLAQVIPPMVNNKFGCIPIVNENNVLCGIITQSDIY